MFEPRLLMKKSQKKHAFLRAGLNAKHTTRHASMSVGVLLHFNAASQHIFDFSVLICFPNGSNILHAANENLCLRDIHPIV